MLGAKQFSQRGIEPAADWSRLHGFAASGVDNHRRTRLLRLPTRLHRRLRSRERSRGATVSDDRPRHRRTDERYPGPSERIRDNPPARRHRRSMHGTKSKVCVAAF